MMSSLRKIALASAGALTLMTPSANAQSSFESGGLGAIDPWGVGTLSRSQGALPNTLWQSTDTDILVPLTRTLSMTSLSPSMRDLTRKTLLSSGRAPSGDENDALLARRFELIRDLGELDIYADMIRQFPVESGLEDPGTFQVDLQMAEGNFASACSRVKATTIADTFWLKARAVCFALEGNTSSAELAMELARGQGASDTWLFSALQYLMSDGAIDAPKARFDSGINLAVSVEAGLESPFTAVASANSGLVKLLIDRDDIADELKRRAADAAAALAIISTDEHRRAYRIERRAEPVASVVTAEDEANEVETEEQAAEAQKPRTALEIAYEAANNLSLSPEEKARAYRQALSSSAGDHGRFTAAARFLSRDTARLQRFSGMRPYARSFAVSAIAAGDYSQARGWQRQLDQEGSGQEPDVFGEALIDTLFIIAGQDRSPASARSVSDRLVEAAKNETERRQTSRVLNVLLGMGQPLGLEARRFLAKAPIDMSGSAPKSANEMASMVAAYQSGALAEGHLRAARLAGRDPSNLKTTDLTQLVSSLQKNGQDQTARALALEGIGLRTLIR